MNAKQFAWAYLVKNGMANMSPSYYGGYDPVDPNAPGMKKGRNYTNDWWNEAFLSKIKTVGVNWVITAAPDSDSVARFAGTFAESCDYEEVIQGTLVLKDGTKQYWCAEALEVSNVFETMANMDELKNFFAETFGVE
jgi:hypothetical protein